jgi:hypothetical protein
MNPRLRIPEQIKIDKRELHWIKKIQWRDLVWSEIGGDNESITWLEVDTVLDTDIFKGVIVDVQSVHDSLFQLHIELAESLRGLGLGTKIYLSLINKYGHLYSSKGRRENNPVIANVLDTVANTYNITHVSNAIGDLYILNDFQWKEQLIEYFNNIKS